MKALLESDRRKHLRAESYPMSVTSALDKRPGRIGRTIARIGAGLAVVLCGACVTTPVTGKKAFLPIPLSQDLALGAQAYEQVLSTEKPVTSGPEKAIVERVMQRLVAVSDDAGYDWEVTLLDAPDTVNAFALPGGKMAVYTGILPVCADANGNIENGLAVVMGHEIGHVVARHGMQRMTQNVGLDLALALLDAGQYQDLVGQLLTVTVSLPFGRADESESDHIGLIYMARAGYNPREAPAFWDRMSQLSGGAAPPEFLSTHPSHETRVNQLNELMPQALAEYATATGTQP